MDSFSNQLSLSVFDMHQLLRRCFFRGETCQWARLRAPVLRSSSRILTKSRLVLSYSPCVFLDYVCMLFSGYLRHMVWSRHQSCPLCSICAFLPLVLSQLFGMSGLTWMPPVTDTASSSMTVNITTALTHRNSDVALLGIEGRVCHLRNYLERPSTVSPKILFNRAYSNADADIGNPLLLRLGPREYPTPGLPRSSPVDIVCKVLCLHMVGWFKVQLTVRFWTCSWT
ncbi:hypothetical protein K474DRAFT_1308068 [Panus rudis PR-1116 ss-1]|nr:hypothetical protein K474DRAFT_1308068 [Panus rudis PR-1116 ss-1]